MKISKWISTIIICFILVLGFTYKEDIVKGVMGVISQNTEVTLPNTVYYNNDFEFAFASETDDFHVKDRQGILNVIYTILNNGLDEFTFYCDTSYDECLTDFEEISHDQILLSTINNMVSPYNSYEKIYFTVTNYGKIDLQIDKLYSDDDIEKIESKVNELFNGLDTTLSLEEQIKYFHDYLINNTVYDEERADIIESGGNDDNYKYQSHKANGPLLEGMALCSGYSDAMKIILDKLKIPNYKVSNTTHIWNLVYLNGKWLNLDLTWDDPITSDGSNLLLHQFFLISTDELLSLDSNGHNFNQEYYPEMSL